MLPPPQTGVHRAGVTLASILAPGLAVSIGVWIVWLILHLPAIAAPPAVAAAVIALAWTVLGAVIARRWRVHPAQGAAAGFVTALSGLLLLGSMLIRPGDGAQPGADQHSFVEGALFVTVAFLAAGTALGAIGALVGGLGRDPAPDAPAPWLARLAWVVAASFLPLLLIGGVVTSTESGLAVTDWPTTFGANMLLYPKELMQEQPRVFYEHSHRLFGMLIGFCTLAFWVVTLLGPHSRRRFGLWATVLFIGVCIQGYLGGQRVVQQNAYLGAVHGAFAQALIAFAGALALWMSPRFAAFPGVATQGTRALRAMTTAAIAASLLQLLLGATFRHLRRGDNHGAFHVVLTHAAFAFVVVALAVIAGAMLIRFAKNNRDTLPDGLSRRLRTLGASVHGIVGLQFVLGWFAFLVVMTGGDRGPVPTADQVAGAPPVPLAEVVLGTAHQINGAMYLVLLTLAWAWGRRIDRPVAA